MRLVGTDAGALVRLSVRNIQDVQPCMVDGCPMLVVAGYRMLQIIDASDGSVVREVALADWGYSTPVRMRILDRHGAPALFATYPDGARMWTVPDLDVVADWRLGGRAAVRDWDLCSDARLVVLVDGGGVRQVDPATGREVGPRIGSRQVGRWLRTATQLWSVAACGGYLFAGDGDGAVWRFRLPSGELRSVWRGLHLGRVGVSAYAVGDQVVVATVGDMAVHLWDGESGRPIGDPIGMHDDAPKMAAVPGTGPARHLLVSGDFMVRRVDPLTGASEVITRWETEDGRPRDEFSVSMEEIRTLAVGDSDIAFVVTSDAIWRIDAHTGAPA